MRALVVWGALVAVAAPANAATLWLRQAHTGEELRLGPAGRFGRRAPRDRARVTHLLRSLGTRTSRPVHPRLIHLLARIGQRFGGTRIDVSSAYRAPADPNGPHAYHGLARAADVRMVGVSARTVFAFCRSLPLTGCGFYPNEDFAHVDARPAPAVWIDLSVGRGSAYVADVDAWLAAHPARSEGPWKKGEIP